MVEIQPMGSREEATVLVGRVYRKQGLVWNLRADEWSLGQVAFRMPEVYSVYALSTLVSRCPGVRRTLACLHYPICQM